MTHLRPHVQPAALPVRVGGELGAGLRVAVEGDVVRHERAVLAHGVDRERARRAVLRDRERAADRVRVDRLLLALLLALLELLEVRLLLGLDVRDREHQADAGKDTSVSRMETKGEENVRLVAELARQGHLVVSGDVLNLRLFSTPQASKSPHNAPARHRWP